MHLANLANLTFGLFLLINSFHAVGCTSLYQCGDCTVRKSPSTGEYTAVIFAHPRMLPGELDSMSARLCEAPTGEYGVGLVVPSISLARSMLTSNLRIQLVVVDESTAISQSFTSSVSDQWLGAIRRFDSTDSPSFLLELRPDRSGERSEIVLNINSNYTIRCFVTSDERIEGTIQLVLLGSRRPLHMIGL
jgi:hypothetical protein